MKEPVFYSLRNDYMFHAVFQKSERALRGLVAALMGLDESEIRTCVLQNPIELGEAIDEKTCVLDIKLLLNNDKYINIEMQVLKRSYWVQRVLVYIARTFSQLKIGDSYSQVKPVVQISILDHTLFEDDANFYNTYKIVNPVTQKIFTDNFEIKVLDLTRISEHRKNEEELAKWAAILKANSWEELTALAAEREVFQEMIYTMKKLTEEEKVRERIQQREDYDREIASILESGKVKGIIETLRDMDWTDDRITEYLKDKLSWTKDRARQYLKQ